MFSPLFTTSSKNALFYHNLFTFNMMSSKEKLTKEKTIFLPGFNGTFNRQGAVYPVIDGLLRREMSVFLSLCSNVMGSPICTGTNCDSVSDDSLQCLGGNL